MRRLRDPEGQNDVRIMPFVRGHEFKVYFPVASHCNGVAEPPSNLKSFYKLRSAARKRANPLTQ
jgi:hypothetical protein